MSIRLVSIGLCVVLCCSTVCPAAEPTDAEKAVALGADWLAAHQFADGGWSFDHRAAKGCDGKCDNPGSLAEARNAPTALAVLALISAGQDEKDARHHKQLQSGLVFLAAQLKERAVGELKTHTFSESGGTMYSHGMATLALCEGFHATGDRSLRDASQKALSHVAYAQDPVGGGWRYAPRQPGDTCISGWQISALLSGKNSMFETPAEAFAKANAFLDSVQTDDGARYGYTGPGAGPATTASGLLNRRRLGWTQDHPAFQRGIAALSSIGPSRTNLYFDLFATAAMRQADEDSWNKWQAALVPTLVDSQAKEGHAVGSWSITGDHGSGAGGRVYCTAFAVMTLGIEHGKLSVFRR